MIYILIDYLQQHFDIPGGGLVRFLSFRAAAAIIIALVIALVFGGAIIRALRRRQIGEDIRELGLEGQSQKKGTPTMGGLIILAAILVPILLVGDLSNVYVQLLIVATVWLGCIGFLDDYIKVFRHNKHGLNGRFKVVGQVGLGIIVGTTMWLSPDVVVKEVASPAKDEVVLFSGEATLRSGEPEKTTKTTIPFVKDKELDYGWFTGEVGDNGAATWVLYIFVAIFIITAVSNAANLTDGLDGLNTGVAMPIVVVLGIFAYLSGNIVYADYLNIMYIPGAGELLIFAGAMVGALIGFLWYNGYPAQVFMGDTGSLAVGGIIAVMALLIRKELLLPIMCGVYLVETCSVIIQRTWFKITKRRYGEGRRVFLMSPIHHHFQKKLMPESKIVIRFTIISIMLAAITLTTLKVR
ncbi:MAG: phospho-N-acetylmuramoyl-pentapeptide-transferase [Rikenellaceae bacterium]|jgi:phospho-N-acetylmuramoyl-pentapeptide-transferase|nr:phospho-N-acetylmuramoyl-pentapeptide-transferase [Rikenellaceae bacterium]